MIVKGNLNTNVGLENSLLVHFMGRRGPDNRRHNVRAQVLPLIGNEHLIRSVSRSAVHLEIVLFVGAKIRLERAHRSIFASWSLLHLLAREYSPGLPNLVRPTSPIWMSSSIGKKFLFRKRHTEHVQQYRWWRCPQKNAFSCRPRQRKTSQDLTDCGKVEGARWM